MGRRPRWTLSIVLALAGGVIAADGAPSSPEVEHARRELLAALGTPAPMARRDAAATDPVARAGVEILRLHDVRVCVTGVLGNALPGVEVRALHAALDLTAAPAKTDSSGFAVVRLPRGGWTVDLVRIEAGDDPVFARVRLDVDPEKVQRVDLSDKRTVRFRRKSGASQPPRLVELSVPDFSFHAAVTPGDGDFDVLTAPGAPLVLQAYDPPKTAPGLLIRREVGAGTTTIVTDADEGTRFSFVGDSTRDVAATLTSVDALPIDVTFSTTSRADVVLSGLPRVAVSLVVRRGAEKYSFYPSPIELDGVARTFTGEPPFDVSVGYRRNTMKQYDKRRDSLSVRVFLREGNGLLLRGASKDAAYEVDWQETLDDKPRASGTMKKSYYVRTPPIDAKDIPRLRYKLRVRGSGEDRDVEITAHAQTEEVVVGKLHVKTHPELAGNVRLWAVCANDAVRAYEAVCTTRRSFVNVDLLAEMPPGTAGWGGFAGNHGWAALPEGWVFGFKGVSFWNGLLGHEFGHVHGFWHGTSAQKRVMQQAGRRAARRYAAIRPGMDRVPEGNRFLPVLEAVTRGDLRYDIDAEDTDADDENASKAHDAERAKETEPDLEATGEDDFLTWYLRSAHGAEADRLRRTSENTWRWALTLRGYTDDEIEASILSRAAGEPLAWLARLRGLESTERRVMDAVAEIGGASNLPSSKARAAALSAWSKRDLAAETDLAGAEEALLAGVGSRETRVTGLRAIAVRHLDRGDRDHARAVFVDALAEARRGSKTLFDETLTACATAWAAR